MLLGFNGGHYFLITGQKLSAREAFDQGVVNEVLTRHAKLQQTTNADARLSAVWFGPQRADEF